MLRNLLTSISRQRPMQMGIALFNGFRPTFGPSAAVSTSLANHARTLSTYKLKTHKGIAKRFKKLADGTFVRVCSIWR
jgi:hypothetical protein